MRSGAGGSQRLTCPFFCVCHAQSCSKPRPGTILGDLYSRKNHASDHSPAHLRHSPGPHRPHGHPLCSLGYVVRDRSRCPHTGRIAVASATCVAQSRLLAFPAKGLMDVQPIVVPGVGVAAAQAGVDQTRANQALVYQQLKEGTDPRLILDMLRADPDIERRQFGIVDLQGRSIGFSGSGNSAASLSVQGRVPGTDIYYSVQGNILASDAVVKNAASALTLAEGDIMDKVMAAMEAADAAGGDRRCTCETEPVPDAPCDGRNAHVAYILPPTETTTRENRSMTVSTICT
jgi:hypothetical protein